MRARKNVHFFFSEEEEETVVAGDDIRQRAFILSLGRRADKFHGGKVQARAHRHMKRL